MWKIIGPSCTKWIVPPISIIYRQPPDCWVNSTQRGLWQCIYSQRTTCHPPSRRIGWEWGVGGKKLPWVWSSPAHIILAFFTCAPWDGGAQSRTWDAAWPCAVAACLSSFLPVLCWIKLSKLALATYCSLSVLSTLNPGPPAIELVVVRHAVCLSNH